MKPSKRIRAKSREIFNLQDLTQKGPHDLQVLAATVDAMLVYLDEQHEWLGPAKPAERDWTTPWETTRLATLVSEWASTGLGKESALDAARELVRRLEQK